MLSCLGLREHEVVEGLQLRCSLEHPPQNVPRKNWPSRSYARYGSLGSAHCGRPIAVGTPVKNPDAGAHELPAVPSFFFLASTLAPLAGSREIIDGRKYSRAASPAQAQAARCSTTTTLLRQPNSMLQSTTLHPSSPSRHMTKVFSTNC